MANQVEIYYGSLPTFSASISGLVAVTGDAIVLTGSASKSVRITRVSFRAVATAATNMVTQIVKRIVADTGGTPGSAITICRHDTANDPVPTASIVQYTAAPTINDAGGGGVIRTVRQFVNTPALLPQDYVFDFGLGPKKSLTLHGVAQQMAINVGQTLAGMLFDADIEWNEE